VEGEKPDFAVDAQTVTGVVGQEEPEEAVAGRRALARHFPTADRAIDADHEGESPDSWSHVFAFLGEARLQEVTEGLN